MKNYKPLLIRDSRHSQIVFFLMTVALFMISGTFALYIKEAVWGLGVLIFLIGVFVLSIVRGTRKDLPRFFYTDDKIINLIYWNGTDKKLKFSDIETAVVDGTVGKSVITFFEIKTKKETIKIWSEIFDSTAELINCLQKVTDIEYKNEAHEKALKTALKTSSLSKKLRLAFSYFWACLFFAIAVTISLGLPSMIH